MYLFKELSLLKDQQEELLELKNREKLISAFQTQVLQEDNLQEEFVGSAVNWTPSVENCFTAGSVTGISWYPGGITGTLGNGINCYSIASVANDWSAGPLGGNCEFGGQYTRFTDSYWCAKTSGLTSALSGTKIEYDDLFKQSTYQNWDFDKVWEIKEGQTTPYLKWMKNPPEEVKKENID